MLGSAFQQIKKLTQIIKTYQSQLTEPALHAQRSNQFNSTCQTTKGLFRTYSKISCLEKELIQEYKHLLSDFTQFRDVCDPQLHTSISGFEEMIKLVAVAMNEHNLRINQGFLQPLSQTLEKLETSLKQLNLDFHNYDHTKKTYEASIGKFYDSIWKKKLNGKKLEAAENEWKPKKQATEKALETLEQSFENVQELVDNGIVRYMHKGMEAIFNYYAVSGSRLPQFQNAINLMQTHIALLDHANFENEIENLISKAFFDYAAQHPSVSNRAKQYLEKTLVRIKTIDRAIDQNSKIEVLKNVKSDPFFWFN